MKGMTRMYDHRGKIAGAIIASLGLIGLIVSKLTDFIIIEKYSSAQHFNLLVFITTLGLFTILYSKEKLEDERVHFIRMKSLMYAFGLLVALPMILAFNLSLFPQDYFETPRLESADIIEMARVLMFYPALSCSLYLVIFHIGLYNDALWDYEDKAWTPKAMFQDWKGRLVMILISLTVLFIIIMILR